MVTDEGAIYITANGGYNWRAAVQETVSATLNRRVSVQIHASWHLASAIEQPILLNSHIYTCTS
jgi:hypothetical protein